MNLNLENVQIGEITNLHVSFLFRKYASVCYNDKSIIYKNETYGRNTRDYRRCDI